MLKTSGKIVDFAKPSSGSRESGECEDSSRPTTRAVRWKTTRDELRKWQQQTAPRATLGIVHPLVIDHPLVADRLRLVRDETTGTADFRRAMEQLGQMLVYEALRGLDFETVTLSTPVAETTGTAIHNNVLFVPVLRAGLGILDAATRLVPEASIGFVGMARDETSHVPQAYLASLPDDLEQRQIFVLDPMLATGGSLIATCEELVSRGARHITAVSVLSAPEGVRALGDSGLPISLITASIDECLDENAFIVPGLGDAGDRLFGPR